MLWSALSCSCRVQLEEQQSAEQVKFCRRCEGGPVTELRWNGRLAEATLQHALGADTTAPQHP